MSHSLSCGSQSTDYSARLAMEQCGGEWRIVEGLGGGLSGSLRAKSSDLTGVHTLQTLHTLQRESNNNSRKRRMMRWECRNE
jgi:hypothetical protein